MRRNRITLDPENPDLSIAQLESAGDFSPEDLEILHRVITLYPRAVQMHVDETGTALYENLLLTDKFTFDIDTDDLILFSLNWNTILDAMIEMAMYMAGFMTMMGNEDQWVVEFTIGAWKPVKNRIKRQLDIPIREQPRGVVGLPPAPQKASPVDAYPFRTLVSHYDLDSFEQMVSLAARDDVAVYFPPETHPKVLAVYVYMRRAMQEVAHKIDLKDHETFNTKLIQEIQRLQTLFNPANLKRSGYNTHVPGQTDFPGAFPRESRSDHRDNINPPKENPFAGFIDQLFPDDEFDNDSELQDNE